VATTFSFDRVERLQDGRAPATAINRISVYGPVRGLSIDTLVARIIADLAVVGTAKAMIETAQAADAGNGMLTLLPEYYRLIGRSSITFLRVMRSNS
jgi:hypothetical protein